MPVFVVGKPGNSKFMSLQLINSSLRGEASIDPLFAKLPGINIISYQGSEDSTSEGILKVLKRLINI